MVNINSNLLNLSKDNDNFFSVTKKIKDYKDKHPNIELLSLGIGDVSKPVPKLVINKMHNAIDELGNMETFKGYGSYYGYEFLRKAILDNEYNNLNISLDEIYISNGTKTDCTSILELFDINSKICITDSMYPIYKDGSLCLNRKVKVLSSNENNNFIPEIPKAKYDIIYICSPNNPIGIAYTYEELQNWIDYAYENKSVILYDNVYEMFIKSKNVPHSIYELKNAKNVAIEFRSFSKKSSFTGVRCSYYIIPKEIKENINTIWKKRTISRFNGTDYIAQAGATATFLPEVQKEIRDNVDYYLENANLLKECFENNNFKVWGGVDSPYLWIKTINNISSWDMFELFLNELNIIIIPGIVFGKKGDQYFRVSSLGNRNDVLEIVERINKYYEKI